MSIISRYLSREERLSAMRFGAIRKLASAGISPAEFSAEMEKDASGVSDVLETAVKLAIGTGMGLGTAIYAVQSAFDPQKSRNRKLKEILARHKEISNEFAARNAIV